MNNTDKPFSKFTHKDLQLFERSLIASACEWRWNWSHVKGNALPTPLLRVGGGSFISQINFLVISMYNYNIGSYDAGEKR